MEFPSNILGTTARWRIRLAVARVVARGGWELVASPEVVEIAVGVDRLRCVVATIERRRNGCAYTWEVDLQASFAHEQVEADVMLVGGRVRHTADFDL